MHVIELVVRHVIIKKPFHMHQICIFTFGLVWRAVRPYFYNFFCVFHY